jgi:hypothetical protein
MFLKQVSLSYMQRRFDEISCCSGTKIGMSFHTKCVPGLHFLVPKVVHIGLTARAHCKLVKELWN